MVMIKTDKFLRLCTREEQAFCSNVCPLDVDVRTFLQAMQKGNMKSAYKRYSNTVFFPYIVSLICDHPCESACLLSERNSAVSIQQLEQACCDSMKFSTPVVNNVSKKNKKVVVIGGGLGGFGCACNLIKKGYTVDLYDDRELPGGYLNEAENEELREAVAFEFERVLKQEGLHYHPGIRMENLEVLNVEAIYIATGRGGFRFGLEEDWNARTLCTARAGVFMSSGGKGDAVLAPLREGIRVANSIDSYLATGRMAGDAGSERNRDTKLCCDSTGKRVGPRIPSEVKPKIIPFSGKTYTSDEARAEANRCLLCTCSLCLDGCDMLTFYRKNPKFAVEEVKLSTANISQDSLYRPKRPALKTINSCNLCGLCGEACPVDLNFEEVFLEGRRALHNNGNLPPAFHDFWLRDMAFSLSEKFYYALGSENCQYVFFPGCQLGGVDPDYVIEGYKYLKNNLIGEVGLLLSCCGAPAYWAGNEEEHKKLNDQLREDWHKMGKPTLITACTSCDKILKANLPEIELLSMYSILAENGLPEDKQANEGRIISVFDPCASRNSTQVQTDVRSILNAAQYSLSELPYHGKEAQCCGYGGHIHAVNNQLMDKISQKRIDASSYDYITYCINCREIFAQRGKPVIHLLDLLLEANLNERFYRKPVHLSDSRKNREALKMHMVNQYEQKQSIQINEGNNPLIMISEELLNKMDRELILTEDACRVIRYCEETLQKFLDANTGNIIGQCQIGVVTYWVVYRQEGNSFRLINIYSHRMKIDDKKHEYS